MSAQRNVAGAKQISIDEQAAESFANVDTKIKTMNFEKQKRKTRLCQCYTKGTCQHGERCRFAHANVEVQIAPDLRKTRICKAFAAGKCDNLNCSFAHGNDELRSTDLCFKSVLCMWYGKGKCTNGDTCRFAHGRSELRHMKAEASKLEASKPDLALFADVPPGADSEKWRALLSSIVDLAPQIGSDQMRAQLDALQKATELLSEPPRVSEDAHPAVFIGQGWKACDVKLAQVGSLGVAQKAQVHQGKRADNKCSDMSHDLHLLTEQLCSFQQRVQHLTHRSQGILHAVPEVHQVDAPPAAPCADVLISQIQKMQQMQQQLQKQLEQQLQLQQDQQRKHQHQRQKQQQKQHRPVVEVDAEVQTIFESLQGQDVSAHLHQPQHVQPLSSSPLVHKVARLPGHPTGIAISAQLTTQDTIFGVDSQRRSELTYEEGLAELVLRCMGGSADPICKHGLEKSVFNSQGHVPSLVMSL